MLPFPTPGKQTGGGGEILYTKATKSHKDKRKKN